MESFQFKEIVRENKSAWRLRMMGNALTWFPKCYCHIEGDHINVPDWLVEKMMEASAEGEESCNTIKTYD